ncbi:MAG: aldo/keto reductase [Robiginitomaculum sp.]|nr:MAG: aldo/keto reductase [Robiginitomaculum sp.]
MQYRALGRTGLNISAIGLGTMTWGEQNTQKEGHAQMDYALARGINFFDTAELYAVPPKPETQGATESIIGTWFKARKNRDQVILATKIAGRSPMGWCRDDGGKTRLNAAQIDEAVEGSLRRLQTDYIDLYQLHWPDRKIQLFGGHNYVDYPIDFTPFEIILEALDRHVQKGNIRHIGVSNETSWGLMRYLIEAESRGLPRMASIQNAYHLLNRSFETGLAEISLREEVGLLAYSPLGQGTLTGKYLNGARPEGARGTLFGRLERYQGPGAEEAITAYAQCARDHGLSPVQLALKFCDTRPFIASTLIGATSMDQLKENIAAFDTPWTDDLEKAVNDLHTVHRSPCP